MYRIPSPPIYRRPPDDLDPDRPPTTHRRPPSPETSISRIFYKSGPLGKKRRRMQTRQTVKGTNQHIHLENLGSDWRKYVILIILNTGTWITREMSFIGDNNEQQVQATLTEFFIFGVYLVVLMLIFFNIHPEIHYQMTRTMKKAFIDKTFFSNSVRLSFIEISSVAHMFEWIGQTFVPAAYVDSWYQDHRLLITAAYEDKNLLYENRRLSLTRLQAVSVLPNSCKLHPAIKNYFNKCFGYYTRDVLDERKEFGTITRIERNRNEPPDYADGKLSYYPPVGSLIELGNSRVLAMSDVDILRNSIWIARGVRAVIVHFNVYNVNLNCFCFMKFIFEAPPTGGIIPSVSIHTTKILKYVTKFDFFILGLELGLTIFIAMFAVEEIREILFFHWSFFYFFWNYIDVLIVVFSIIISLIIMTQAMSFPKAVVEKLELADTYYVSYFEESRNNSIYETLSAIVIFLAWFKVFKYMTFTKKMENIVKTLNQTCMKLFDYGLLTLVYFEAFMFWGFFLFHAAFENYSTFFDTFISLLRMCDGDFDFDALRSEDWFFGPIFIITYITLFYFILANVIVAIINEAYQIVRENENFKPTEMSPMHFLGRAYYNIFCGCKKKVEVFKRMHRRARLSYQEFYNLLRGMNFTREEISMFFAKYNICQFRKRISPAQLEEIAADMEVRGFHPSLPHDVERYIRLREKRFMQEATKRRFHDEKHYHVFTYAQYELLQTELDQLEILLEMSCSRLGELLKILKVGVKYNWVTRTQEGPPNVIRQDPEPRN